ncbi:MAG: pentapeptide repeat-containing protein [Patescibacteria group bacterium]|nr:pentapeptide repeat-containing protein [Patescibacteria group bacterium]
MIKIKNCKIFTVKVDCKYHWSNLPMFKKILQKKHIDLRGADLRGANLKGVDLRGVDNKKLIIQDFMFISSIGSPKRTTMFFKTNKNIMVQSNCFYNTLEKFESQVKEVYKENKHEKEYLTAVQLVKIRFEI